MLTHCRRFRWVSLVENEFSHCINAEMRQNALENLPSEVEDIYANVLGRIPKLYQETVRQIFMWLAYSIRPLTLEELASAVSIECDEVVKICTSSLVSLQRENELPSPHRATEWSLPLKTDRSPHWKTKLPSRPRIVKFDHFSVKEYLTLEHGQASKQTSWFYTTPMTAHLEIAKISVSHLLRTNDDKLPIDHRSYERFGNDHLLRYSIIWPKHIQEADAIDTSTQNSKESRSEALSALPPPKSFTYQLFQPKFRQSCRHWVNLLRCESVFTPLRILGNRYPDIVKEIAPMVIATLLDLPDIVEQLLCDEVDINEKVKVRGNIKEGENSITLAAIAGNLRILKLLLKNGASLEQSDLDYIAGESREHGAKVLRTILEHRKDLVINDETVMMSAENRYSKEILERILDVDDKTLPVTLGKKLLVAIVRRCSHLDYDDDLLEKILGRADDFAGAKEWVLQAFLRHSSCRRNIRFVIDRHGLSHTMAEEIVNWVLDNPKSSDQMLLVVLQYFTSAGVEITFNEEMLMKAATDTGRFFIILNHPFKHTPNVVITKDVMMELKLSGKADVCRQYRIDFLMDHEQCEDEDFEGIVFHQDFGALYDHIRRCPKKLSRKMTKAAVHWEQATIEYLQAHARPNVKFTKESTDTL